MQQIAPVNIAQVKDRLKDAWAAGDFGKIAQRNEKIAEEFVDDLPIAPGMTLLDVACGTGNVAIPAARKGTIVTGVDIVPALLDQARARAAYENLAIAFHQGDAEQLPYSDEQFDMVTSMFGAMFAPQAHLVAQELVRVCKKGGMIAMANWAPSTFVADMFAVSSKHVPPPPGMLPPVLWGDVDEVTRRFAPLPVTCIRRPITFDIDQPPPEVVGMFRKYFGPTVKAFESLDSAGQQRLFQDLVELWSTHNSSDDSGRTVVHHEYVEVRVHKA